VGNLAQRSEQGKLLRISIVLSFVGVVERTLYHRKKSQWRQLWSELSLNLMSYMDWRFLREDFINTMLRVLYQEPLPSSLIALRGSERGNTGPSVRLSHSALHRISYRIAR
jgi:hypothetical protein